MGFSLNPKPSRVKQLKKGRVWKRWCSSGLGPLDCCISEQGHRLGDLAAAFTSLSSDGWEVQDQDACKVGSLVSPVSWLVGQQPSCCVLTWSLLYTCLERERKRGEVGREGETREGEGREGERGEERERRERREGEEREKRGAPGLSAISCLSYLLSSHEETNPFRAPLSWPYITLIP